MFKKIQRINNRKVRRIYHFGGENRVLKKTACVILALMTVMLTGCWNNRNITDLAIVTGIGIDKASDGNVEFTAQIISPSKSGGSQSGSGSSQSSGTTINVSAEGATVFDAARNLIPSLSQKAYYAHVQLLIIGEDAAKNGLDKIWDFFERDHETNKTMRAIVAKNGTAKSVLEASADVDQIGAVEVANTMDNTAYGKNIGTISYKVTELLSQPLAGIVIGVINPSGATALKSMKVEGGAVFKYDMLEGYLDNDQARGYLFAANQLKSSILTIANPKEAGKLVSIEVINSSGKLTAELVNGKPKLGIEVTAKGNIGEEQGSEDLTDDKNVKTLTSEAETLIKENIKDMADQSQKVFDCDILNFNDILYKHHYSDFEKIKGNWDELYRNADINIKVQFLLDRHGMIKKPAYNQ
jgi:spore germination protein KC